MIIGLALCKGCPVHDLRRANRSATLCLTDEGEVVEAGDATHGVVNALALEAAVAENLPRLHAGEGMLDTSPDLAVGSVVLLFPGR